jgi:hypothetical protein
MPRELHRRVRAIEREVHPAAAEPYLLVTPFDVLHASVDAQAEWLRDTGVSHPVVLVPPTLSAADWMARYGPEPPGGIA